MKKKKTKQKERNVIKKFWMWKEEKIEEANAMNWEN